MIRDQYLSSKNPEMCKTFLAYFTENIELKLSEMKE